ncbi:enhancer of mRNA-decapping protein 4-like [Epargyreus clarus]|uniref:enhancer of mRNA-decapping protein 4-like n=1 Tax=Epargyreus clarus TaxID=520877 RepID=UPI003C2F86E4
MQGNLPRSKSTGFLDKLDKEFNFKCFTGRFCGYSCDNRHTSAFSIDGCSEYNGSDLSTDETKLDSGIGKSFVDGETLFMLEQKVDKLSELFQEQYSLLQSIKEEVINSKPNKNNVPEPTECVSKNEPKSTNETVKIRAPGDNNNETEDADTPAQNLLNALETNQDISLDQMIKMALDNFLQSDGLKERVASVTAECVKGVVRGSLYRVVSNAYLPMVERSHRRLVKHVTKLLEDSFTELEEGSASLFKPVHRSSKNIRLLLERHLSLLESTDPLKNITILRACLKGVLEEELKTWREKLTEELSSSAPSDNCHGYESELLPEPPYDDYAPLSPQQPADPNTSVIDSLMQCALIKKHIEDGDVSGAFELALGAGSLALVAAACRAAPPRPPAPRRLRPAARLALAQQLATDMLHDTQLKCRYLEEAILSLDQCDDTATRAHYPLVVGDIRKHLTKFLHDYPNHHASRRIALILMAVDDLIK